MSIDLLVFGPHPDDLELGLGGTIARHAAEGRTVGLCDVTAGELGTNGTPEIRLAEAREAGQILGAAWRECLEWPDGGIDDSPDSIREAVAFIRKHQPRTIAIPYWQDRHPDHVSACRVLDVAAFRSGLRRYDTGQEPWRPDWVCYYFINDGATPSFVIDVSPYYETKQAALACYRSQFQPDGENAVATRLTSPTFRQLIASRDQQFGALAGVPFAEGVVVRQPIERSSLHRDLR